MNREDQISYLLPYFQRAIFPADLASAYPPAVTITANRLDRESCLGRKIVH